MGEETHDGLAVPGQVVLAHELPFTLGVLRVDPARRQVECAGRAETLEPRVMQVLVVLARANGRIVTRDELIAWCWSGRIVGEDAINRAIFRLRQVAAGIGSDSFAIETVPKVGYRVAVEPPLVRADQAFEWPSRKAVGRRTVLVGGGAVAISVAGATILTRRPSKYRPKPEAEDAWRRGHIAQRVGTADQSRQSVAYFERAVRLDPNFAAAWGALALAYTHNLDGYGEAELASLPGRINSAARHALALDPDNADARLAIACIKPFFRNWGRIEPELRAIRDRHPTHWLANGRLGMLLYQVGRFAEGAEFHKKVIQLEPMIVGPYAFAATALSAAGRIQEADTMLDAARDRWPAHPMVWFARYGHLLTTGRPEAAAAFVTDPNYRPTGFGAEDVAPLVTLARAVELQRPDDVQSAIAHQRTEAGASFVNIPDAVQVFGILGAVDDAFAALDRYFFNRGSFGPPAPIGPYSRRATDFLFVPATASLRKDSRFSDLTRSLGLDDYWRKARVPPPLAD